MQVLQKMVEQPMAVRVLELVREEDAVQVEVVSPNRNLLLGNIVVVGQA